MSISIDPEAEAKRKQAEAEARNKIMANSLALRMNRISGTLNNIVSLSLNRTSGNSQTSSLNSNGSSMPGGSNLVGYIASTDGVTPRGATIKSEKYGDTGLTKVEYNKNDSERTLYTFDAANLMESETIKAQGNNHALNGFEGTVITAEHFNQIYDKKNFDTDMTHAKNGAKDVVDNVTNPFDVHCYSQGGSGAEAFLNFVYDNGKGNLVKNVNVGSATTGESWIATTLTGFDNKTNFTIETTDYKLDANGKQVKKNNKSIYNRKSSSNRTRCSNTRCTK